MHPSDAPRRKLAGLFARLRICRRSRTPRLHSLKMKIVSFYVSSTYRSIELIAYIGGRRVELSVDYQVVGVRYPLISLLRTFLPLKFRIILIGQSRRLNIEFRQVKYWTNFEFRVSVLRRELENLSEINRIESARNFGNSSDVKAML